MTKPAGKIVSLTELRFKPANSNDAARAAFAHHFAEVPHCSFAKDDGISQYLNAETGMAISPVAPDSAPPRNVDIPSIQQEKPEISRSHRHRLLRGGFALSVFLHAAVAIAVGVVTIATPEEPPLEEGMTSVTLVVQGDVDARAAGNIEEAEPVEKPRDTTPTEVKKPIETPVVEDRRPDPIQPVAKKLPLPTPTSDLPKLLTAEDGKTATALPAEPQEEKTEPVADTPVEKPKLVEKPAEEEPLPKPVEKVPEKKIEPETKSPEPVVSKKLIEQKQPEKVPGEKPKPVEQKKAEDPKPEPVEKKSELKQEKKPEPRNDKPKKEKAREKRASERGNQGKQQNNGNRGDVDSKNKGLESTNSRGDSKNPEKGNSSRINYKGLVNKKLARAKGRFRAPAQGEVKISFTILANGSISGLRIVTSSGKPAVDSTALKIVNSASPFPSIPEETERKTWPMTVSMSFNR